MAVNEFCEAFLRARSLFELNHLPTLLQEAYQELGLIEDPDFLFSLEGVYNDFKVKAAEDSRNKATRNSWKKIV